MTDSIGNADSVRVWLVTLNDGQSIKRDFEARQFDVLQGWIDVSLDDGPPAGRYLLLEKRFFVPVDPDDPIPVFLHDGYEANIVSWDEPMLDRQNETNVSVQVARQVADIASLDSPLGAVLAGPVHTQVVTHPVRGLVMRGTGVVVRPVRP